MAIDSEDLHVNIMENVDGMEILLMKRAMMSLKRAKRCIFCDRIGTFRKSLLQKGFLTQNGAKKGKRAIRARLACFYVRFAMHAIQGTYISFTFFHYFFGRVCNRQAKWNYDNYR